MSEKLETLRRVIGALQDVDVAPFVRAALTGDTAAMPPEAAEFLAAWLDMLDPDIEIDTTGVEMPGFGVLHGPEGMRELWLHWIEEWEHYSWTHSNWIETGDHVIADARIRATGKGSGVEVIWDHCQVWTFGDGKVVRWLLVSNRTEALETLGLSE
jgi:ketosteroid isomerase-like protein